MRKRYLVVLLLILTSLSVYAGQNMGVPERGIPEYDDFPLDNIHILRLQDAATSLGGNVSELRNTVESMELRRSGEISELQGSLSGIKNSITAQVVAVQGAVEALNEQVSQIDVTAEPAKVSFPPYLSILLTVNIILLLLVIFLILYLREKRKDAVKEPVKEEPEEHIHPAPKELVDYISHQLDRKRLHDIRLELAGKGWSPSIIEHAIRAAREK